MMNAAQVWLESAVKSDIFLATAYLSLTVFIALWLRWVREGPTLSLHFFMMGSDLASASLGTIALNLLVAIQNGTLARPNLAVTNLVLVLATFPAIMTCVALERQVTNGVVLITWSRILIDLMIGSFPLLLVIWVGLSMSN